MPRSSTRGSSWPHGSGRDEAAWPAAEDRYASDLLLAEAHRGSVAAGADGIRGRRADPDPARRAHARRAGSAPRARSGSSAGAPDVVDVTPGLRRDPPPDLDAVGEDEALVARIHAEIERDGPITFARFMDLALYDPDGGYYRAAAARPGRDGDFLTAPEAHPIFGAALAAGRRRRLGPRSTGPRRSSSASTGRAPGRSAVADPRRAPRRAAGPRGGPPLRADRGGGGAARRDRRPIRGRRARRRPRRDRREPRSPIDGVVLANEVLDALPTHRVVARRGRLREVFVGSVGRRLRRCRSRPVDARARRAARRRGRRARRTASAPRSASRSTAGCADAAAGLERGVALFIDYGYPASRALRPGPPPRRDAPRLPPPPRPRRSVHPRRSPGPDRPRRRHGRRDGRPSRPASTTSGRRPRPSSSSASGPRSCSRRIQADPATTIESLPRGPLRAVPPPRPERDGPLPGHGVRPRLAGRRAGPARASATGIPAR